MESKLDSNSASTSKGPRGGNMGGNRVSDFAILGRNSHTDGGHAARTSVEGIPPVGAAAAPHGVCESGWLRARRVRRASRRRVPGTEATVGAAERRDKGKYSSRVGGRERRARRERRGTFLRFCSVSLSPCTSRASWEVSTRAGSVMAPLGQPTRFLRGSASSTASRSSTVPPRPTTPPCSA